MQLTFRKQSKYKTQIGGIASVLFFTVLFVVIGLKALTFAGVQNANTFISNAIMTEENSNIDLFKLNFRFAVE